MYRKAYYKTLFGVKVVEVLAVDRIWEEYRSAFDEYVIRTSKGKIKVVSGDRIVEF